MVKASAPPEGKAAMAAELKFTIGVQARCSDGHCGEVRRLIIDPATDAVTHLVIQPGHQKQGARLVPADLVESTEGEIRLRCTRAEFDRLDHAEERELTDEADQDVGAGGLVGSALVYGVGGEAYAPMGPGELVDIGPTPPRRRGTVITDVVPMGEEQVRPGDRVHAVDGEIGRVEGFLVHPGDDRVTHVLLAEGHLWGRKEVAIPVSAVTKVDIGIRLNLTKEQVEHLPPAG
jgi:sporulation protein YlmC with PRC-barrel domain